MKIIVVAATETEIAPLIKAFVYSSSINNNLKQYYYKGLEVFVLITGVGMTATAYHLGKTFAHTRYDAALNIGLAGSFDKKIHIGDVVNVTTDIFSELGAEDGEKFLTIQEIGLLKNDEFPYEEGQLINNIQIKSKVLAALSMVKAITVNSVHGNDESIKKAAKKFSPQVESMEGAAFLYGCLTENIPYAQVRAISNYVERRNKENWNIGLAIENLNKKTLEIINDLTIDK